MDDSIDPFLQAHVVGRGFFNIGGNLSPVSVRDQMLRAQLLIERAFESGVLTGGSTLMIVGAGAAGLSAAMTATHCGIGKTIIIQKTFAVQFPQTDCWGRWLDPCLYDWPYPHWWEGRYPVAGGRKVPLRWFAGVAARVVIDQWFPAVNSWIDQQVGAGKVDFIPEATVRQLNAFDATRGARDAFLSNGTKISANMILCCTGTGAERSAIVNAQGNAIYASPSFWEDDQLQDVGVGTKGASQSPKVVIYGGGDGALQDVIRCLTRESNSKTLLQALDLPDHVCRTVQAAQAHAVRSHLWSANRTHDHAVNQRTHEKFRSIVDSVWLQDGVRLSGILDRHVIPASARRPIVQLVFDCDHFYHCYAANRMMVMLLAKYLTPQVNGGVPLLLPQRTIVDVKPAVGVSHKCDPRRPELCIPHPHRVTFGGSKKCWLKETPFLLPRQPSLDFPVYDRVVVRRGPGEAAMPIDTVAGGTRATFRRHVLPFYLLSVENDDVEAWA